MDRDRIVYENEMRKTGREDGKVFNFITYFLNAQHRAILY